MAKKKGSSTYLQIIVGLVVLLLIGNLVYWLNREEPKTVAQVIAEKLAERRDISPRRREQLRIQLAVTDYMDKHGGEPPASLSSLVPIYFDRVPIDPDTNSPFAYSVRGNTFIVGTSAPAGREPERTSKAGAKVSGAEADALIASLDQQEEEVPFIYDPTGKRDPFQPFNMAPKLELEGKTELERFSLGQLRLTAVLEGMDKPSAIVETSTGKGFTVTIGTKIGVNSGEVIEILPDKLLILETSTDFTGKKQTRTVEMKLRTKNQN